MRVFLDSNVLISAARFPDSVPYWAVLKAITEPNECFVCEQNIEEARKVFSLKFPNHIEDLETFLFALFSVAELVPVPKHRIPEEQNVRDLDDRSILRAAIWARADILVTGDKDFIESQLESPKCLTPSEFLFI